MGIRVRVRLYGSTKGNTSWPRVTKGMASGLMDLDSLASIYPLEDVDDMYECLTDGFDAPMGVFIGPPSKVSVVKNRGDHEHRLAIIAANSSWLPRCMDFMAEDLTGLIGPSKWACGILRNYTKLPVFLWRHGVSEEFHLKDTYKQDLPDKKLVFRVLHMASTHMERKGTSQLIFAWTRLMREKVISPDSGITLIVSLPHGYALQAIKDATDGDEELTRSFKLLPCQNMSERDTRDLYQDHHIVCQPSRGEGFGMILNESMASGVPVVATGCTGHSEFLDTKTPGAVVVEHGAEELIDDGPGAMAPSVSPEAVFVALKEGYERWAELTDALIENNKNLKTEWSWENVSKKFFDESGL